MAARNMYRIEINVLEKELCVKLVIYKDYTEMQSQQNKKLSNLISKLPVLYKSFINLRQKFR